MNKSAQKRVIKMKNSPEKLISILATVFSGLLVITGVLTLVIIRQPIQERQDLRRSASTGDGQVTVEAGTSVSTTFPVNTTGHIDLAVNTHGVQTDGVQLVFDVVTDSFDSLNVEILSGVGLQSGYENVQPTSNGFKVAIIAIPQNIGSAFSTNSATSFLRLSFTPTQDGPIQLNFDQGQSISTVHSSNPPTDELKTVSSLAYTAGTTSVDDCTYTYSDWSTCTNNQQTRTVTSKTPSNCTTPSPVLTQACTSTPGECVYTYSNWGSCTNGQQTRTVTSKTPSNCTTPNPILTQTCSNNTSNASLKSCNESCSSNADCQANYVCYSSTKTCRLATNPSNSSCQGTPDNGLNRSCNEYCADTNECGSGYFCFYNRCRVPENPDSTSCTLPSSSITAMIAQNCNKTCQTNSQCGANMRCYNSQCRLASNPSSTSCSSAPITTYRSNNYQVGSTASNTKGADLSTGLDTTKTSTTAAIVFTSPIPTPSPMGSVKPMPAASTNPQDTQMLEDQTAFEALTDNIRQRGLLLPIAMIGSGLLIMLLVGGLWLMRRSNRQSPIAKAYKPSADDQKHLSNLEKQIKSLQEKPPTYTPPFPAQRPLTPAPGLGTSPIQPTPTSTTLNQPSAASPSVTTQPDTAPLSTPAVTSTVTPGPDASSTPTHPSNMVERLKQKGVQTPTTQNQVLFDKKESQDNNHTS